MKMEESANKPQESPKRKYSITIQIILSLFLLLYAVFFVFSFIPSPQGSPIADHPYTPWDIEMVTVKLLFILFAAGYYYSWKSRLISGAIFLAWCVALVAQVYYISSLLHDSGDAIVFAFPVAIVAFILLISGNMNRKK